MKLSNLSNAGNLQGLAIGAAVVILAPVAIGLIGSLMRPLAKAAIKGGLLVYDTGKEVAAGTSLAVDDLVSEARAEVAEERESKVTPLHGKNSAPENKAKS
jgi:hypothetical protein